MAVLMQSVPLTLSDADSRPEIPAGDINPANGSRKSMNNKEFIYYDGYWIRYYTPPADTLAVRKQLIDHLTRRAFHHTEPGINTPGGRLDTARKAYEDQTDPTLKRINAAMLAGALFNRATDIFTAIVELEEKGVKISRDNELMKTCGHCFKEALELGRQVRHHSGEEGIDELWGEPFRVFTTSVKDYFQSRYIKISLTMANIDKIGDTMKKSYGESPHFSGVEPLIDNYTNAAKCETETMKADDGIFQIWPRFVAAGEALGQFQPVVSAHASDECRYVLEQAQKSLVHGQKLISWISRARVPMPKSTAAYIQGCSSLRDRLENC